MGSRGRRGQAIVAAIVGFAFALHLVWVPLHLAWNDHALPGTAEEHGHGHGCGSEHGHGRGCGSEHGHHADAGDRYHHHDAPSDDTPSNHSPHPATDHFEHLAEAATPPSADCGAIAHAPSLIAVHPPQVSLAAAIVAVDSWPRPPPLGAAASPRAPPIVA